MRFDRDLYFTRTQSGMKVTVESVTPQSHTARDCLNFSANGGLGGFIGDNYHDDPELIRKVIGFMTKITINSAEDLISLLQCIMDRCS